MLAPFPGELNYSADVRGCGTTETTGANTIHLSVTSVTDRLAGELRVVLTGMVQLLGCLAGGGPRSPLLPAALICST